MKTIPTFTEWSAQIEPRHKALYKIKQTQQDELLKIYNDIVDSYQTFIKLRKQGILFLINESSQSFFKI